MSVLNKLNEAKPVEERNPFIGVGPGGQGNHEFAILEYRKFNSTQHGEAIGADLLVLKSDVHPPGSIVFSGWFINRKPNFPNDNQETDRAVDFLAKLVGGSLDDGKATAQVALGPNADQQPLRGMRIACTSQRGVGKKSQKEFIDRTWTHVPQTQESIAALRAELDQKMPLRSRQVAPSASAPVSQPAAAPAPAGLPPAPAGFQWAADGRSLVPLAAPAATPAGGYPGLAGILPR